MRFQKKKAITLKVFFPLKEFMKLNTTGHLNLKNVLVQEILFPLTAGRAKKEIAKTEKQDAIVFPIQVWGTLSP